MFHTQVISSSSFLICCVLSNIGNKQIQESITGPVAGAIALAAVAIAGGMLIFGGELNDFARRLVYVVLVAGILLGATNIVGLFGATGASIGLIDEQITSIGSNGGGEGDHG